MAELNQFQVQNESQVLKFHKNYKLHCRYYFTFYLTSFSMTLSILY